ncbi:hypothetical protein B0H16DRAFT_1662884 [Mycena metata]|uniref:Hemerythrin-like domain-containing protein n=1 Tax=Mycena metata TaxID=1033252 RepID=A0AAD7J3U5_9AGAR|nr:hypothetical protein B0H16DRAFT_1662884 [Mycena metata]
MVYPTDPYESLQYNMEKTHDLYKLAYETIIPHLDNPPLNDLDNFLGYCRAWASSIVGHHDSEEAVLFPFLNKKLDFSHEIEQHVQVAEGLTGIINYIDESTADHTKFDAAKLKDLMEKLSGHLFEHLDEEVEDLAPEKLKVYTAEEITQAGKDLMVYIRAHSEKFITLPFMRCHTPPELKEIWPPFPWIVKRFVVPWILAPKHAGYWKYAPYPVA